jgi:FkbM family methyltransferase
MNGSQNCNIRWRMKVQFGLFVINSYIFLLRGLSHFIKLKTMTINRYGKTFFVSGNLEYFIFWKFKSWEINTYKIFDTFLDPDHSYIDIGAFIGPTVLYGAQIAKKVYAFEPDPFSFKELKKNISLNPHLKEKIEVHEKCLNSHMGKVKFGSRSLGGDTISSLLFADAKTSWIVDGITFDEFIRENKIKDCNFIKMDIEGGEAIILPSMKHYLEENKPVIHVSLHQPLFTNPVTDTKNIIGVLTMYNNIYTDAGKKIEVHELLSPKRLNQFYAIVATDNEWKNPSE